ncbi:hypothetical protein ACQP2K_21990 [Microbispora siamensis]
MRAFPGNLAVGRRAGCLACPPQAARGDHGEVVADVGAADQVDLAR